MWILLGFLFDLGFVGVGGSIVAVQQMWVEYEHPTEFLKDTSFFEPDRADTGNFGPILYGYNSNAGDGTNETSFESCMNTCIQDSNCHGFQIKMVILPFYCQTLDDTIANCTENSCGFVSDPYWHHFRREYDSTDAVTIETINDNSYYEDQTPHGWLFIKYEVNSPNFDWDYIEITTTDAYKGISFVTSFWLEYQKLDGVWYKCQNIELPHRSQTITLVNECYDVTFPHSRCDIFYKSWDYSQISARTTEIDELSLTSGNVWYYEDICGNLVLNQGQYFRMTPLDYTQVQGMRIYSSAGKVDVVSIEFKEYPTYDSELVKLSAAGEWGPVTNDFEDIDAFVMPTLSELDEKFVDSDSHTLSEWYFEIIDSGGHLWCRNKDEIRDEVSQNNDDNDFVPVIDVFKRKHHICRYKGATKTEDGSQNIVDGSGTKRIHQFTSHQCSFDSNKITISSCQNAYISIYESCHYWTTSCQLSAPSNANIDLTGDYPVLTYDSSWNRQWNDETFNFDIDYYNDVYVILWNCDTEQTLFGCEDCYAPYFESINNPYSVLTERVYHYSPDWQFCRPQPNFYDNQCELDQFCPKFNWRHSNSFTFDTNDAYRASASFDKPSSWTCRTRLNTGTTSTNGFGCWVDSQS